MNWKANWEKRTRCNSIFFSHHTEPYTSVISKPQCYLPNLLLQRYFGVIVLQTYRSVGVWGTGLHCSRWVQERHRCMRNFDAVVPQGCSQTPRWNAWGNTCNCNICTVKAACCSIVRFGCGVKILLKFNEKHVKRSHKGFSFWQKDNAYLCCLTGSAGGCSSTLLLEADAIGTLTPNPLFHFSHTLLLSLNWVHVKLRGPAQSV